MLEEFVAVLSREGWKCKAQKECINLLQNLETRRGLKYSQTHPHVKLTSFFHFSFLRTLPGPDPCDMRFTNILDSADRAQEFITDSDLKCDRGVRDFIYHRWNRFNGSAGVAMSTKCVDTMRCGANAPGWLQGGHPRVSEGVVTRQVCYHWDNNCCYFKNNIQVKNCKGYFVYKLERPPAYKLRYCGNGTGKHAQSTLFDQGILIFSIPKKMV